jgi:excisionase family DNA binding protein
MSHGYRFHALSRSLQKGAAGKCVALQAKVNRRLSSEERFMALRPNFGGDVLPDPIEPLLGVDRAAHLLGISVKTLRDWIQYRRIDYVKVGTRVMIRPETIRHFVVTNTRRAEAG